MLLHAFVYMVHCTLKCLYIVRLKSPFWNWPPVSTPQHDRPRDLFDQLRQLWDDQSGGALNAGCWVFFTLLVPQNLGISRSHLSKQTEQQWLRDIPVETSHYTLRVFPRTFESSKDQCNFLNRNVIFRNPYFFGFQVSFEVFSSKFSLGRVSSWVRMRCWSLRVARSGRWVSKDDEKSQIELEKYEKMMTNPEDLDWYPWVIAYSWLSLNWQNDKPSR